ncbi:MFS transporter [Cohnella luojiensis]|uniref:MFS transporter n=1 Tax=Cohnella luojiensis TaxID=652876 RepID=UPI001F0FD516|nr:MFS transporter [Cohnella luojiensis]
MDYTSNLWKLYAFRFISSLIPAYVIERLYWEERGMTIQKVVFTEIIYALTIVLLEVPTGIMADKWGRKRMLVLSAILGCSEFLILLFATEFWHFATVVFLAGISRASSSGSENALLYDTLALQGKAASFEKQLGRLNACDFGSAMLAALCGSLLASKFNLELNYWISLGSALIALLLSISLIEPPEAAGDASDEDEDEDDVPFKRYVTESLRFFRVNPGVRLIVLSGMITGAAMGYIYEFWQLYANRLEVPIIFFGVLSAAIMLLQLPGNLLAHLLIRRFSYRTLIFIVITVIAIGFTYVAASMDYIGLAAMLVICLFSGVMEPIAAGYLHHRIDSSMRATIDSFRSLGENALSIIVGLGFGYFSTQYDVFGSYGFIAFVCFAFLIWFIGASRKFV